MPFPADPQEHRVIATAGAFARRQIQGVAEARRAAKKAAFTRWARYYLDRGEPIPRRILRWLETYAERRRRVA